ncbi:hypothetical protein [Algicella marina]|uniref:Component of SufBCD complex n=1 Tax=Algicella marina TaxID=2683284 RepID=A0A6P1SYR8_9RHOB|nr:hypothetical protein [Algicella marina]QHQ34675.1 hypothetical protein GO499_05450 [Algicella marina]
MNGFYEIMNLESLWTLWFWIVHVVAWSMTSHFVLGVPFDAVLQANREKEEFGPWARHTDAMLRASIFRIVTYFRRSGAWIVGVWSFVLASLFTFALLWDNEFSIALLTVFLPLTAIYTITIRWALWIDANEFDPAELRLIVRKLRFWIQLFGVLAIIVAAACAILYWLHIHVPVG